MPATDVFKEAEQTEKAYQKQDNVFVGAKKYLSKNRKLDRSASLSRV